MKSFTRFAIAVVITMVLSFVAIGVWAGPGRQGTVPVPTAQAPITPGTPVTLGTVQILVSGDGVTGTATIVPDPATVFGPPPEGLVFLADAVMITLSQPADINICYSYPKALADKNAKIFKWDETTKLWVATEGTVSGDPQQICFLDKQVTGGSYTLLGQ